jgi:hypothetical protein
MIFVAEITCVGFMSCNETVNGPLLGTEKCGFIGESENSRGEKGGIFCNEKCNALRSFVAASAKQLWLHQPMVRSVEEKSCWRFLAARWQAMRVM